MDEIVCNSMRLHVSDRSHPIETTVDVCCKRYLHEDKSDAGQLEAIHSGLVALNKSGMVLATWHPSHQERQVLLLGHHLLCVINTSISEPFLL